jgi:hypothetical protein
MVYVVRAIHVDGVTGTFTTEKNTFREAKESAKSLREMGLLAIIAHSSDGDQWFQTIVITVSSDRDQAQHELFTVLSIGAAANTTDGLM